MRRISPKHNPAKHLKKNAGALLTLLSLTLLVGCQGVSIASHTSQQQTGSLSFGSTNLSFGSVAVGSTKPMSITATNTGTTPVTISSAVMSAKCFTLASPRLPVTIEAGHSTPLTVQFVPNATGAVTANATLTSNAANPAAALTLSGTGTSGGQLAFSPGSESFGSVAVGSKQAQTVTLSNTGTASVNITQASMSGTGFQLSGITTPFTLSASQSTTMTVSFAPLASGSANGTLTISSDASSPLTTMALSGTGVPPGTVTPSPASLSFGSVTVGSNQSLSETLTNSGGTSITISQITLNGTGFNLSGITAPLTLAAGQSASFSANFAPQSSGTASGSITIASNASDPTLNIALAATGVAPGALSPNPSSLSFGNVNVGSNQSLSETVTNTGGASVTISQVAITGTGFSFTSITTPLTLAAGQSKTFSLAFTPSSAGTASGTFTITSNAPNPTLTVPLSGTGVVPGTLGSNPTSLSFGSVTVGASPSLSETVTNSGGTSVTISQVAISGTGFSLSGASTPITLAAGQSTSFSVSFTPAVAGSATGTVTVTSNASNPSLAIPLSGTGLSPGLLGSNPASLSFGSVTVGSSQSLSETVTNTGGTSVTVSQVAISGSGFSLSGITTPITLASGQSKSFTVTFAPTSAGSTTGSITLSSNASNPTLSISISGTGTAAAGQLAATPTTLDLGSVVVGTSGTASGSLTASGANVTVTSASSSNSAFSVGLSLPVTIPAGQSVAFTVTFSPQATGTASATLTFTSNAQPSTTTEMLTGTGTPAPVHTVNLSWNASTSPNISGYNIYRTVYTSACGSFSKINSVLNTSTLYADSTVVDGTAYCYATTAVNSSNEESGYSNIVSNVQIPAP